MNGLYKTHSLVNIPFSWENQPGISKVAPHSDEDNRIRSPKEEEEEEEVLEFSELKKPLPPPPGKPENTMRSPHGIFVPLPPCAFQPPPPPPPEKKLSKKEGGPPEDPFLAAYMECTKSRRKQGSRKAVGRSGNPWRCRLEKLRLRFSCGCGGGVREDAMVRLSPTSKLPEERECDVEEIVSRN